ncbi:BrnT family toxin [Dolichospermum sp. UHCC 0259]|uniref:BrnT family toxin n=1 Tax=Dolichospermum sp. UHCC 0259 TaxID=2590010 RepID=UPI001446AD11|nr:BrnT family toxin [Dolichospermum sp. UHCC 0259]MTJ50193.1 hypothetical protein [Dolichospermum sp. UHCC 0259]
MNFVYQTQGIEFEWDINKAESNFIKHGVRFEEAVEAFFDPFYQEGDYMSNNEEIKLQVHPRVTEVLSLKIPRDTLTSLEEIAVNKDMSIEALLKFYIGQGLREDISKLFNERLLNTTVQVLSRHIESQEEVSKIIQEIKSETIR